MNSVKPKPQAAKQKQRRSNLISEYWYFLTQYRSWWLFPVLALALIVGTLVVIGGSQTALLMYALF